MNKKTAKKRFLRAISEFEKLAYAPPPGDPAAMGGGAPGGPMGGDPMAMLAALGGALPGMGGPPPGGAPAPGGPMPDQMAPPPPPDAAAAAADAGPAPGEGGSKDEAVAQLKAAIAVLKEGMKQLDKALDVISQGIPASPAPAPEETPPAEAPKVASFDEKVLWDWLRLYANR